MFAIRRASLGKGDKWTDFCKTPANALLVKEYTTKESDLGSEELTLASLTCSEPSDLGSDNNEDKFADLNLSLLDLPEDNFAHELQPPAASRTSTGGTLTTMCLYEEDSHCTHTDETHETEPTILQVKRWQHHKSIARRHQIKTTDTTAFPVTREPSYTDEVERYGKPTSWIVCNESTVVAKPVERPKDDTLERTSLRLDGLEAYILVGVLVSTASFTDVLGGDFWNTNGSLPPFLKYCTLFVGAMVTLLGMYSTIIFASTILYGKTAVGMSRDDTFVHFMEKTKNHRIRGFNALAACIIFFAVEVCLVVADQLPSAKLVPPFLAVASGLIYFGVKEFQGILHHATPIFTNIIPVDDVKQTAEVKIMR